MSIIIDVMIRNIYIKVLTKMKGVVVWEVA